MIQRLSAKLGRFDKNQQVFDQLGLTREIIDLTGADRIFKLLIGGVRVFRLTV